METNNCTIHWIEIYPVDSAIRRLNNRGQVDSTIHLLNNWCRLVIPDFELFKQTYEIPLKQK